MEDVLWLAEMDDVEWLMISDREKVRKWKRSGGLRGNKWAVPAAVSTRQTNLPDLAFRKRESQQRVSSGC
jgi:hypothetical protein